MELTPGSFAAGKYRVVRVLGRGTMGTVWEAVHTLTDRRVALKILAEDHKTTEARARILREARACGRIQHKNVIEVFDIAELDDGRPFLVMPLLQGETLEDRIERAGPCSEPEAIAISVSVTRALVAAHALGVVHRDLKPSNIFLHRERDSSEVVVKVLDFGISKILSRNEASYTDAGRAVGSPAYMSPEQAKGAGDIDGRTDLWSLGITLFEMLTGELPFPGETPYAMVGHILHGPPPDFDAACPAVSAELRAVLRRCVERNPKKRFASAEELLETLSALQAEGSPGSGNQPWVRPSAAENTLASSTPLTQPGSTSPGALPPHRGSPPPSRQTVEAPRASSVTDTSSVLVTQKLPRRRSRAWGWAAGAVAVVGLSAGLFVALGGRPVTSSNTGEAPAGAAPPATASTDAAPAASPTSPRATAVASATSDAAGDTSSAAPQATSTPQPSPPRSAAPAKGLPLRRPHVPTSKTGRVALPDSPG